MLKWWQKPCYETELNLLVIKTISNFYHVDYQCKFLFPQHQTHLFVFNGLLKYIDWGKMDSPSGWMNKLGLQAVIHLLTLQNVRLLTKNRTNQTHGTS